MRRMQGDPLLAAAESAFGGGSDSSDESSDEGETPAPLNAFALLGDDDDDESAEEKEEEPEPVKETTPPPASKKKKKKKQRQRQTPDDDGGDGEGEAVEDDGIGEITTALREIARVLADDLQRRVVVIDTSKHLNRILELDVEGCRCLVEPGIVIDKSTRRDVLALYGRATMVEPQSYRAWHQWGLSNYRAIEESRGGAALNSRETEGPQIAVPPTLVGHNRLSSNTLLNTHRYGFIFMHRIKYLDCRSI